MRAFPGSWAEMWGTLGPGVYTLSPGLVFVCPPAHLLGGWLYPGQCLLVRLTKTAPGPRPPRGLPDPNMGSARPGQPHGKR